MGHKVKIITFDQLNKNIKVYIHDQKQLDMIEKSYHFALDKYKDKIRLTGEDYINHPLGAANILTEIRADYESLILAIIHDVDEEWEKEIEEELGNDIYKLWKNYQKITNLNLNSTNPGMIDNYKKIMVGICEDARIIIIKLAARLDNMKTLYVLPEIKQKQKARENLEILAPIAHRLGIQKLKSEIEDLSLRYLKPDIYYDIVEKLNTSKLERDLIVNEMIETVSKILIDENITHKIKGRSKSIYSIYKKLEKGKKFSDIYDLFAMRIIVNTKEECYSAIGYIHSKYKPMPGRFKDYIAMPKSNMYQSLHSTVFVNDNSVFEVQVRTEEMDKIAEFGIANHWSYKEKSPSTKNMMEQKLEAFRNIIETSNEDVNNEEFMSYVKEEILDSNIYVYTPKGDVIELPKGATPIDFAYKVHTGVGHKMIGAIVNNIIVPLDYQLNSNDVVKVNTNNNSKGPSKSWIKIVKTSQARNKIKAFFTKKDKEYFIKCGEDVLNKALRKNKIPFSDFLNNDNKKLIFKEYKLTDEIEMYLCIGNGKLSASALINFITKKTTSKEDRIVKRISSESKQTLLSNQDVIVEGIDEIKVNLASCCKPIPGDEIVGYISKGKGITVHQRRCHNIEDEDNRIIDVKWNKTSKRYPASIIIYSNSAENILMDVISKASSSNTVIDSMKTINATEELVYDMTVLTESVENLMKFINDISSIKQIIDVRRIIK